MNNKERSEARDAIIEHGRFPRKENGLLDLKKLDEIIQGTQYQRDRMAIYAKMMNREY